MAERITLYRAKGWRKPEGAVIVARPSIWGNPWQAPCYLHADMGRGGNVRHILPATMTVEESVEQYRNWLNHGLIAIHSLRMPENLTHRGTETLRDHLHARRGVILANLHNLHGRDLCCWCKPGHPCHADVLVEMASQIGGI